MLETSFAHRLPKAELHLHIEGTFEPELIFELAERNRVRLPYHSIDALRQAYEFTDLQSFLNLYYDALAVLRSERDFADLAHAYLARAKTQGVVHAEIFFDPQAHIARRVRYEVVLDGLWSVLRDSERRYGITTKLILCFLRDMSAESAMGMLETALAYQADRLVAVGLDSAEVGNPPTKFRLVFDRARAEGLLTVAHAGRGITDVRPSLLFEPFGRCEPADGSVALSLPTWRAPPSPLAQVEDLEVTIEAELIELDERITVWRVRHFKVVQRTIGADVIGTQGTPVEVMGRLIHHSFFPELWDVRNDLTRMNLPE